MGIKYIFINNYYHIIHMYLQHPKMCHQDATTHNNYVKQSFCNLIIRH